MNALKRNVRSLVVEQDAFALGEVKKTGIFNYRDFEALTSTQKIDEFKSWFNSQVDNGILFVDGATGEHWQNEYVQGAYKKGLNRSYTDVNKAGLLDDDNFFGGQRAQWLSSSLNAPESIDKLQLLYARAYDALEGVTQTMDKQLSMILAEAISNGQGPAETARQMIAKIDSLTSKRAFAIARTETIRAHAHGQLMGMERLGIKETEALVEFRSAGDDRVCPQCLSLEGTIWEVEKAYGVIPIHVGCRCAWSPYIDGKRFNK